MVRGAAVVERVLNELEARQADIVERNVAGAAGVGGRERFGAEIAERPQLFPKVGTQRLIALHVNTPDFARAIVQIEIHRKVVVIVLLDEFAARTGAVRSGGWVVGVLILRRTDGGGRVRGVGDVMAEMFGHIRPRTQQSLLFAAPKGDANGAARLQ